MKCKTLILVVLIVTAVSFIFTHNVEAQSEKPGNEKLVIIWSSADRDVALKMAFMYAYNAKKAGWWDDITLVVWGPSEKVLTEDQELQENIKIMIDAGIVVKACKL